MTFIQLKFLIFLVIAVGLFYACKVKYRWIMLLGISIAFYVIAGIEYLPFILITTFTIYLAGRAMGKIYEASDEKLKEADGDRKAKKLIKEQSKKDCKKYMLAALLLNIGILCVIKYTKFFVNPINDLIHVFNGEANFSAAYIIVPLGISYYTFSTISYLLDVYWRRVDYEKNYFRFLLYAIYFPHILQGPIERYGKLGARLKNELRFDYDRCAFGAQLILWGFFKKLVIADRLDIYINTVYSSYSDTKGIPMIIAMLFDVVYIYADFSGCMDIARGVSDIFGIELDLNFNHPFSSTSIVEFWRRWHMSLGSWFKDYVYYPVSTSNLVKGISKKTRKTWPPFLSRAVITVIPVFCTWFLTGLWHGTGKTYVAWGIYYSIMIFCSVTFEPVFAKITEILRINTQTYFWKAFSMARTTLIFAGGRILTRPGSLYNTLCVLRAAVSKFNPWVFFDNSLYNYGLDRRNFLLALVCILLFGIVSHMQMKGSVREFIAKQNLLVRWGIYVFALVSIIVLGIYGPGYNAASFVYMAY